MLGQTNEEQLYVPEAINGRTMPNNSMIGSPSPQRPVYRLQPLSIQNSRVIKNSYDAFIFPVDELQINTFPQRSTPITFSNSPTTNSIFRTPISTSGRR